MHRKPIIGLNADYRSAKKDSPAYSFLAAGYYDLATPYYATLYTLNHMALDPDLRGNLSTAHYEAGHMMYIHMPSLKQMKVDLSKFIKRASNV